jgi:hypothetical protein
LKLDRREKIYSSLYKIRALSGVVLSALLIYTIITQSRLTPPITHNRLLEKPESND